MIVSLLVFASQKYLFELNGSFKETTKKLPDKSSFSSLNTFGAFFLTTEEILENMV